MENVSIDRRIYSLHAEICKTLSNPTRLEILNRLRDSEKSVGELASLIGARQANISQHLAVLRRRGIVTTRKEGANIYYKIANPKIIKACDIIREVLFEQLAESEKLTKLAKDLKIEEGR